MEDAQLLKASSIRGVRGSVGLGFIETTGQRTLPVEKLLISKLDFSCKLQEKPSGLSAVGFCVDDSILFSGEVGRQKLCLELGKNLNKLDLQSLNHIYFSLFLWRHCFQCLYILDSPCLSISSLYSSMSLALQLHCSERRISPWRCGSEVSLMQAFCGLMMPDNGICRYRLPRSSKSGLFDKICNICQRTFNQSDSERKKSERIFFHYSDACAIWGLIIVPFLKLYVCGSQPTPFLPEDHVSHTQLLSLECQVGDELRSRASDCPWWWTGLRLVLRNTKHHQAMEGGNLLRRCVRRRSHHLWRKPRLKPSSSDRCKMQLSAVMVWMVWCNDQKLEDKAANITEYLSI